MRRLLANLKYMKIGLPIAIILYLIDFVTEKKFTTSNGGIYYRGSLFFFYKLPML